MRKVTQSKRIHKKVREDLRPYISRVAFTLLLFYCLCTVNLFLKVFISMRTQIKKTRTKKKRTFYLKCEIFLLTRFRLSLQIAEEKGNAITEVRRKK